ncbi:acyl-CoA dehydrogenase N-terminal domain-containing protein, partial [Actinokineospora sp.]|uniref:acyl-CoA dehydrogenase N-terminal domain-containing protein n=1 Tax=Actinokineospora sp. TaxID=1872133 RepID=UPI0040381712
MGHYKSNVRDLEFNLFEVFNVQDRLGKGVLAESDEDPPRGVHAQLNQVAVGPRAGSIVESDPGPPGNHP